MIRATRFSVVIAAFSFLLVGKALGQVRTWVSPSGIDTNPCTLQQPCRNFAAAITAVAPAGEVVALSSGGFGPVTITKSVSLISPEGVHAAIAPTTGAAVTVNGGATDRVVLRNLYLNAQGADRGVFATGVLELFLESLVVSGFAQEGVRFAPNTADAQLFVSESTIRMCDAFGIRVVGGLGTEAFLNSVRLLSGTGSGIHATQAQVKIQRSVASGYQVAGFQAGLGTTMVIEDTTSTANPAPGIGFYALTGALSCNRCLASSNGTGIRSFGATGIAYVARSTIFGNDQGVSTGATGVLRSRGDNTLQANTLSGAFTNTFPAE